MNDEINEYHCMKQEQWAKKLLVFGKGISNYDITDQC